MKRNAVAWAALVVSVAALIGSRSYTRALPAAQEIPAEGQKTARALSEAFNAVAEYVKPSVVQITVEKKAGALRLPGNRGRAVPGNPREIDPKELEEMFKKFFGPGSPFKIEPQQFVATGTGSGFVYDDQGHIMTNNHVVDGADKIKVTFHDGVEIEAKVVGTSPDADVAIIKVPSTEYRAVKKGNPDDLKVGEWVLAIGSPFGLSQSVTSGIVSATERDTIGINPYESFIQTDAAINQGNSGGPLVNMDGRVVGINSAIATMSGSNAGVGFAIPMDMASRIAEKLIKTGKINRALMGVVVEPLTRSLAKQFGLDPKTEGVVVMQVGKGTPADKAGLKVGDVIQTFDGEQVHSRKGLQYLVHTSDIGKPYEMTFLRNGEKQTVKVAPAPFEHVASSIDTPSPRPEGSKREAVTKHEVNDFGLAVEPLTPELAEKFGYDKDDEGLVVAALKDGGPAQAAGLEVGDLILKVVKDKKIQTLTSAEDFDSYARKSDEISIYVRDKNHKLPDDFKTLAKEKQKD